MPGKISRKSQKIELRLFRIGVLLILGGSFLTLIGFGPLAGASFLAGGALAIVDLAWLRHSINSIVFLDPKKSKLRILLGFFLRLLLIPICLYAMIRFLFLDIIAVVAGFAVFVGSVFIEGILEALGSSPK